jgi:hypothetical protein
MEKATRACGLFLALLMRWAPHSGPLCTTFRRLLRSRGKRNIGNQKSALEPLVEGELNGSNVSQVYARECKYRDTHRIQDYLRNWSNRSWREEKGARIIAYTSGRDGAGGIRQHHSEVLSQASKVACIGEIDADSKLHRLKGRHVT